MITRLKAQNYRVLRDIDCPLSRFTCIVGPNGCGKSTLLEVLRETLRKAGVGPLSAGQVYTGSEGPAGVYPEGSSACLSFSSPPEGTSCERFWEQTPSRLRIGWRKGESPLESGDARALPSVPRLCVQPSFEVEAARAATKVGEQRSLLHETGDGLAGLLADWKLEDDPRLEIVTRQLSKVVPQVVGIIPKRNEGVYTLQFLVGPGRRKVPAKDMSTGTLYALALLVMLQSLGGKPALLLLDDLDQDLHPAAQGTLIEHLRAMLDLNQELQIVATSHSPYLVDHMDGSEVLMMALDDEGFGHVAPMTSHPDYNRLRGLMRPGEFWSAVGEQWVVRPASGEQPREAAP